MQYPDSDFILDFSAINWTDYRGINQFEVISTYKDSEKEWHAIRDLRTGEWYYHAIGFSSKVRFLFVLLKDHENEFNRLVVNRIIVAEYESQIREFYYTPKFKKR